MSQKLEESKASGAHLQLSRMVGEWNGTSRVWFDPAKLEDESPISGTMRLLLDGRFVLHEYKTTFRDQPITGMAIYGYNIDLQKFQCAWIDSFHSGSAIMFSEGNKGDQSINILGSYAYIAPDIEQYWGWRTTVEMVNDAELVITAFNISPEGEESRATEIVYKKIE
jgi:hypothetical protein